MTETVTAPTTAPFTDHRPDVLYLFAVVDVISAVSESGSAVQP
jgi:hypothetical protein